MEKIARNGDSSNEKKKDDGDGGDGGDNHDDLKMMEISETMEMIYISASMKEMLP